MLLEQVKLKTEEFSSAANLLHLKPEVTGGGSFVLRLEGSSVLVRREDVGLTCIGRGDEIKID
jgi:hypothetical protein